MLHECSIIITTRPISSGDLHPVVSTRIEVLGFTPDEQWLYFTECFKGDTKAMEALLESIEGNAVVQSVCYTPLDATFVVHSYMLKGQILPNSLYEIYLTVILDCIQQHFKWEGKDDKLVSEVKSLHDFSRSEGLREPFQNLCEVAYRGVMENKIAFSSDDLPQGYDTLGLLQATKSFLECGTSVFYTFLHLPIQEVLSAFYIATWLSDSEQVSQLQQLFDQPHFAAVLQFYAAITKLRIPGIRTVIGKIAKQESKPLLVSLFRCLFETQDPSICLYVFVNEELKNKLDLSHTLLSPRDCFSISFFLSSVAGKEISIHLWGCYVEEVGAKFLTKYLGNGENHASKQDALAVTRFIEHLYISDDPIGDTGAPLISEIVRETAMLKSSILHSCAFTSKGNEHLQNCTLEKFDVTWNNLGNEGMTHNMIEVLKQNTQLKELWIGDYGIKKKGTASLVSAVSVNNSLSSLHMVIYKRTLTAEEISSVAQSLAPALDFIHLIAKVDKGATASTLTNLNTLRKRVCTNVRHSDVLFRLITLKESSSFIISWRIPSILVPHDMLMSAKNIQETYVDVENIMSLSVGNLWLYNPVLSQFGSKLKKRYQQSQSSPSPVEWIPSPTNKIFRLAMIQRERMQRGRIEDKFVRMTISGRVDDVLHAKSPVELETIFVNGLIGSEIVLIEGAPGSGKSTLTVHICQRWGRGELFQQFTVVILVQLRDPVIQRAHTIADLLPVENIANAHEIATNMLASNGRGVLWVLDGWDELPLHLQQQSIFCKLIKRALNESSVVVTSRPISSGSLRPVVSSRFEVLGFTPDEQKEYFTDCLKGDTKALEVLLEKIQENPVVQSICSFHLMLLL